MSRRPTGRPPKTEIDTAVQTRVVEAIKLGSTYELAALYGGISYATFRNWMRRGEAEEVPYLNFFKAIKAAEGEGTFALLQKINTAANDPKGWQAAAWILERRYPEMYGRQRIEHTGKDGGPIEISWRDKAVEMIQRGELSHEQALEVFDNDDSLVADLFARASARVSTRQG